MENGHYHTAILKHIDEVFIEQWKMLWEKAENANIYNSYEWFLTFLHTVNENEYELHVCYRDGELVALLPLQVYRCFGIKTYGTIYRNHQWDTPFLIEKYDKELFQDFFGSILQHRKTLYIQKIDDKATQLLHELFPDFFFSLISVNPTVSLTQDPFANASESLVQQVKRLRKKYAGELRFAMYSTDLERHLEAMLALQEKSSKKARSMDIFADEENKRYYRNLTKYCSRFVKINLLYYNNEPIAYEFGFLYKDIYAGDQISYHNEHKKLIPGKMIVFLLTEELVKQNVQLLDVGGGISNYKMQFTNTYRILYNLYYSRNVLILSWWRLVNTIRRQKQVFFPKKNTRDHEFLFKTF
jgi:CelD/BcsL family acetyltransferase involved in cellulose biosynthesis